LIDYPAIVAEGKRRDLKGRFALTVWLRGECQIVRVNVKQRANESSLLRVEAQH
jgi:hypothetical protein